MAALKYYLAGDAYFHRVFIHCFSQQFWQGDIYPRWSMDVNAGLGAPIFIFYPPLPYFITALLYPLKYLGASPYVIYEIGIFLATLTGAFACYSWLKDIVSPSRAFIATTFFLFVPYRMEVMFFRADYAELWAISWLPLLFKYLRLAAKEERKAMTPMAIVFALLLLSHPQCALAAIIGSWLYMVIVSGKSWRRPMLNYAMSLLWGISMAAFYLIPAAYYSRFVLPVSNWSVGYLDMDHIKRQFIWVLIPLNILVLSIFCIRILRKYSVIEDKFMQSEIKAWVIIFIAMLFLALPIAKPLYDFSPFLVRVVFPWRMQSIFVLCLPFMIAVWIQYFISDKYMKTWKADYFVLIASLILVSYMAFSINNHDEELLEKFLNASYISQEEYFTIWARHDEHKDKCILSPCENKNNIPSIKIISGGGSALITHWDWRGIILQTDSNKEMTLRLDHYWFPTWHAAMDSGQIEIFRPDPETGKMLLDIPAGQHSIYLKHSIYSGHQWMILANIISILAVLFWLLKVVPNYKLGNMLS